MNNLCYHWEENIIQTIIIIIIMIIILDSMWYESEDAVTKFERTIRNSRQSGSQITQMTSKYLQYTQNTTRIFNKSERVSSCTRPPSAIRKQQNGIHRELIKLVPRKSAGYI